MAILMNMIWEKSWLCLKKQSCLMWKRDIFQWLTINSQLITTSIELALIKLLQGDLSWLINWFEKNLIEKKNSALKMWYRCILISRMDFFVKFFHRCLVDLLFIGNYGQLLKQSPYFNNLMDGIAIWLETQSLLPFIMFGSNFCINLCF